MKRSVSSVLAERRKTRRGVTPTPISARHVKFTPEEMAYDAPKDTSGFVVVGRGPGAIFKKPSKTVRVVKLDSDVAASFKDAAAVNEALRRWLRIKDVVAPKARKSA